MKKYLLVFFVNLFLIGFLLLFSASGCLTKYGYLRMNELFRLTGLSFVLIIAYLFTNTISKIKFLNKILKNSKLNFTILITVLVFGFKYIEYGYRIIKNIVIKEEIEVACSKIIERTSMQLKMNNLTRNEYELINESMQMPFISIVIPDQANNISFDFYHDLLPPDFHLNVKYEVPANVFIEEIDIRQKRYVKKQSFEVINGFKLVTYFEADY